MKPILFSLLLLSCAGSVFSAPAAKGESSTTQCTSRYATTLQELLPKVAAHEEAALKSLEALVHEAARPGAEAERLACCNALIAVLNALDTPLRVKACLLRQLQMIGKEESIATLVKLLSDADPHLAGDARAALIHNPACPEQYRKQFLAEALAIDQKDPEIAGDRDLQKAWERLHAGQHDKAKAAFTKRTLAPQPRQVRFSALRGTLAAAGDAAVPQMVTLLAGEDADGRAVALGWINELGAKGRLALLAEMPQLPVEVQAIVMESLAGLGVEAILPLALRGVQGSDPVLQHAGLVALARLGQAGDDQAVIAAMNASEGKTKVDLIDVLLKRGSRKAVPALFAVTAGKDAASTKAAFRALKELVNDAELPQLLSRLAEPTLANRGDMESLAIKALARLEPPDRRSQMVQAQFAEPSSLEARQSSFRLYCYCADARSLAAVKAAMNSTDAKIREAAFRALFDWGNSDAWDLVVEIFQKPEKPAFGVLAWRSLLRRLQDANKKASDGQLVARYAQLFTVARSDDDRRALLGALGSCGHLGALELALQQLSVPALRPDAEVAVKGIAELIRKQHPKAVKDALEKVSAK